jgi:hypothetical protein
MQTARIFLCYAPRAGLRCALAYLARGHDVCGWFIGPGEGRWESAYFLLEDFYTSRETRYVAVPESELHSRWTRDEAMCHELARMQETFAREWLFYRDDPDAVRDQAAYEGDELALGDVNIRHDRLNRLSKLQANWTLYSRDFEHPVLKFLSAHWPLDYRIGEQ